MTSAASRRRSATGPGASISSRTSRTNGWPPTLTSSFGTRCRSSCLRLVRALAVETHENWLEANRYLNMDELREQKKTDRKSVVEGKSVSVRGYLGGRRIIKKKKNT